MDVCLRRASGIWSSCVICRKEGGRRSEAGRGADYIPPNLPGSCPNVKLIDGQFASVEGNTRLHSAVEGGNGACQSPTPT